LKAQPFYKMKKTKKSRAVVNLCSILGIVNENGKLFSANYIIEGISLMNERCNGLGGDSQLMVYTPNIKITTPYISF